MPSANLVIGSYFYERGYTKLLIPDRCPQCYTIKAFCRDHPRGRYVVGTGVHVVAIIDGDYYDTWDSGNEVPIYYWKYERTML